MTTTTPPVVNYHTCVELTEQEFDDRFPLRVNHLNPSAGWSFGDERGCLFETYGSELAFIRDQDPRYVWTLVDDDEGRPLIVSGFRFVNRIGYFLSRVPVPDGYDFSVPIECDVGDDAEFAEEARV